MSITDRRIAAKTETLEETAFRARRVGKAFGAYVNYLNNVRDDMIGAMEAALEAAEAAGTRVEYRKRITRDQLRAAPDALFVFGDNFSRRGLGGQAAEMRDEPNAVGIPTKRYPSNEDYAFLQDHHYVDWIEESAPDWMRLFLHEGPIVWPADGIGTGLADLPRRAPVIFRAIKRLEAALAHGRPLPTPPTEGDR